MSQLPKGWTGAKLADIGRWSSGGTPSRSRADYFGSGVPWVKSGDLPDGPILRTAEEITDLGLRNSSAKLMPVGTISMALYGATIGKLGVLTFPAATNQACANVVPHKELIEKWYLFFYLMYERRILIEKGQGGAQPNISQEIVKSHPIVLAPLNEQRRIVTTLEKLLSRVAAAQSQLANIPRILKRFRQAVLETACSGRLTADWRAESPNEETASALLERIGKRRPRSLRFADAEVDLDANDLPESWLGVRIEELTHIQNGRAFPSNQYKREGVRLLRPGNLHINGQVEWNEKNTACLPKQWGEDHPEFLLGAGELLMNLTAQSLKDEFLGRVCVKTDGVPALLNQRIARFRNHGNDDLRPYLFIYLKSPQFRSYVNTLDTGSLIRHMHSKQVLSHVAPLPPLAEQQEIVRRVEALFKTADALEARYRKAKAHVDKLTQSILAKAFRGELVPHDPNDEPASALLERIRGNQNVTRIPKPKGKPLHVQSA
jgi:type I restriction enzyme S subunit